MSLSNLKVAFALDPTNFHETKIPLTNVSKLGGRKMVTIGLS
jgi:hypothetical protein